MRTTRLPIRPRGPAPLVALLVALLVSCGTGPEKPDDPTPEEPAAEERSKRGDEEEPPEEPEEASVPRPDNPFEACEKEDADVCFALGNLFEAGAGVPRKPRRAAELFARACRLGQMAACYRIGEMYRTGTAIPGDAEMAIEVMRRACKKGEPRACAALGEMLLGGEGVEKPQPDKGRALLAKACESSVPGACTRLGTALRDGEGGERDVARAAKNFERACAMGAARGCMRATWLSLDPCLGDAKKKCEVGKDPKAAAKRLSQACADSAKEKANACAAYGMYLEHGRGVARDMQAAERSFTRACEAGSEWGCYNKAAFLRGAGETDEAIGVLDKLCRAGFAPACRDLAGLLIHQKGNDEAVRRGAAYMKKGCQHDISICAQALSLCALGIEEVCAEGQEPGVATE